MDRLHEPTPQPEYQALTVADVRLFSVQDGAIVHNPKLGQMWVENKVSADLYFAIVRVEAALSSDNAEYQEPETARALSQSLEELYGIAISDQAATWTISQH